MRKIVFYLILILFLFLPSVSSAQPVIDFASESYDAGIVSQGDIIEHTFEFTNEGDEELIIEKVTPS